MAFLLWIFLQYQQTGSKAPSAMLPQLSIMSYHRNFQQLCLYRSGSQPAAIVISKEHLTVSGDTTYFHN